MTHFKILSYNNCQFNLYAFYVPKCLISIACVLGWVVLFRFSLDSFKNSWKMKPEIQRRDWRKRGNIILCVSCRLKTWGGDGIIGGQRRDKDWE